ncbi:hypothetical protein [Marivirga sp.]|uniref:hypothetical protein n=1 Tax=Marivirga sp. TaxID=2018662 RepID=UPI002D805AEE|nr:hypothetical protein [Marivirga sp.]HET8860299.1 hypothetical protein [Marivirga sp.]
MRLAQAARKLSITTEDIIDFLEIRGIIVEKDSNTKLEEKAVQMLWKYFEVEEENKAELQVFKEEDETSALKEEAKEKENIEKPVDDLQDKIEESTVEEEEDKSNQIEAEKERESDKKSFKTVDELLEDGGNDVGHDFVIKAPKVELKGLNVVGKIELPEPKPKNESSKKKDEESKSKKSIQRPSSRKTIERRQQRELSPTEIRKREKQKEARKREQAEKEKKQKREKFYKEKILKPKQIEQKAKPKKKKSTPIEPEIEQRPKPKTVLGKFWRWLNT